ncbi:MAG: hypothetical protein JXD23_15080 [Spirochaetales bacterium]|nr:hypothetical protein [Spirochaetales bacterium]
MKKILFALAAVIIVLSCRASEDTDREGYYYDKFRGDDSSIINLTQYESFLKCLNQFDFGRYRGTAITFSVNAPNDFVASQISAMMKSVCEKNDVAIVVPRSDGRGRRLDKPAEAYDLQLNAICGGYHFYDGLFVKNYTSITRLILVENDLGKNHVSNYDSGYREYRYGTVELADAFKVFFFALLLLIAAVFLVKAVILRKKNSAA